MISNFLNQKDLQVQLPDSFNVNRKGDEDFIEKSIELEFENIVLLADISISCIVTYYLSESRWQPEEMECNYEVDILKAVYYDSDNDIETALNESELKELKNKIETFYC